MLQRPAIDQTRPLWIAVLAMGGQGGGVLVDWVVALAESQNWIAQSTSVPGVAQRTGATIYYVEMIPARPGVPYPVLSLMPVPGDVDIVVGAELMEAGRAIQRGLVTPDRTTLIASSLRSCSARWPARWRCRSSARRMKRPSAPPASASSRACAHSQPGLTARWR